MMDTKNVENNVNNKSFLSIHQKDMFLATGETCVDTICGRVRLMMRLMIAYIVILVLYIYY